MMALTVVGMLRGQLLDPTFGPVNTLLKALGVANPPVWMGDPKITLYRDRRGQRWQYAGFPMIVFLAAMENIPLDIHDAATIDGANPGQRIARIIFPMIKNVIVVMIMLQIIFSLKVFDVIWVMTQGGPGEATNVLGIICIATPSSTLTSATARPSQWSWLRSSLQSQCSTGATSRSR